MQELNIVILNNNFELIDSCWMIHELFEDEPVTIVSCDTDMYDLLVKLGIFCSRSEARKNWTRTGKEIPFGYNEFKDIGKQKKALYIWNPIKESD
jgi:hypothetical protein